MSSYHYSLFSPTDCTADTFFNNGFIGLNGFLLLGNFNNGFNGFTAATFFNNGFNGFNGFTATTFLTTDLTDTISRGCTCLRSALPLARARSAPTKKCTNQARRRINRIYRCYFFNNGLNGLNGFTATTFLTTDLTDLLLPIF